MKNFWRLWLFLLLTKLVLSALIPLSADEAYYWVWSERLQLSYFDHPPMVAWLFYIGHFLEPFANAVRWPAVILGHGMMAVWYLLLNRHASKDQMQNWIGLVLLSPLLGFGSLLVTPDLPVLFFWSLSIYLAVQALDKKSVFSYLLLGAALGLGFCAKYHIVLFIPCLLVYLTVEKRWREVRWAGVLATIAAGLIFCAPVLLWNLENNFASFEFQLKHGLEESYYDPRWTGDYVGGQILLLFPLIFWAALRARVPQALRWAYYFGWGPLLFFLFTSLKASVEANWPIIAYPAIFTLALYYPRTPKWSKIYYGFFGVLYVVVLGSMIVPTFRNIHGKVIEPYHMQEVSEGVRGFSPLYASNYQIAASLWYLNKVPTFKLKEMSRIDFFDTFPEAIPSGNKFYLIKHEINGLPGWFSPQEWQVKEIKRMPPDFVLLEFTRP